MTSSEIPLQLSGSAQVKVEEMKTTQSSNTIKTELQMCNRAVAA